MTNFWHFLQRDHRTFPVRAMRRVLLVLGLMTVSMVVYWGLLLNEHQAKIDGLKQQTDLRSEQLAKALSLQVETLFSALDFVAQNLVAEYASDNLEGFNLAVQTALRTYPSGSILQIAVADRDGRVVYSNLQSPPTRPSTTSIRDRAHFRVHAESKDSGLFISQPLMGRVSRQWAIQLSRAVRVNGQFAGVIVISVSPAYLSGFFHDIFEQPSDVILLLRDDGAYMARSHDESAVLGKSVRPEREFLTRRDKSHGSYEAVSSADGVDRFYAWSRIGKFPLVISVGIDRLAVLARVQPEIRKSLLVNGIGSVVLLAGTLVIAWLTLQRQKAKALVAESEQRLHKLVAQVPGALFQFMVRPDGSSYFPFLSPGTCELFHVTQAEISHNGKAALKSIHPEDAQRVRTEIRTATANLTAWESGFRVSLADAGLRWLRGSAKPERNPDGSVLWHGYVHDVTHEHEVQEALRVSEEHLRLTVNAVHDGLWQWDLTDNSMHWDARCCDMIGYEQPSMDLTHDSLLALMHPRDRERFQQQIAAHLKHGDIFHCEFRLRTAAGGWLWLESRGNVTDTLNGKPTRMLGTHTDISQRVAQAQLLRALLDESSAVIFLVTPNRHISYANARAEEVFGTPGDSLTGKPLQIIHNDEASFLAFGELYKKLRLEGSEHREWAFKLYNGETCWFETHGTLLDQQDPNGEVIWTFVNTDERHRVEVDLRIAEQRLMAIIERFPGGALVQDQSQGAVLALNQAMCDLLRLPLSPTVFTAQPLGKLTEILSPQTQADYRKAFDKATDIPYTTMGLEYPLADGRVFEIHRVPLARGTQELGLLWLLRDITERKQRESSLEQMATTDPLTTLPNRRSFMARMTQELDGIRHGTLAAGVVVMLDIDFFKKVNDTWGHAVGDQVLRHLADLLENALRQGDMAGRLGGEEFAFLLAATDLQGGLVLAERLRESIASHPVPAETGDIQFTVSLGVSVLDAQMSSIDECLAHADAAMYYAKRHGKNQVTAWKEGMVNVQPSTSRIPAPQ